LLIEMEPQVAGAYELFLAGRGYAVTAVSTVAAGLRAATVRPPDVVIVGTLPDSIDASTVAQRLRAVVSPRPCMVVVLSGTAFEIEGADIVIPTGAHPRAVLDAVRTAGRRRPITAPLATAS